MASSLALVPYSGATVFPAYPAESLQPQDFAGLNNQGATCYMNSLLQTLFMTPEFRAKLYQWTYDEDRHGSPEDCIPLQLQLLFAKLHLSHSSVWTTGLTKSFGWNEGQSFQQHDAQEFCRVLFDAIEQSVSGTSLSEMIRELFQSTLTSYVKCLVCHHESCTVDFFLDWSLTIRNPFEGICNGSVEEALENYLKPEILSGTNQYFCSNCDAKCDAQKGFRLTKLPYILSLQLKRFDLDYNTFERVKLNDVVKFPLVLNLNAFVYGGDKTQFYFQTHTQSSVSDYVQSYRPADYGVKRNIEVEAELKPIDSDTERLSDPYDSKLEELRAQKLEAVTEACLSQGDQVYELFSVLVHSGSAFSGHYFAYIKCFENKQWYEFNDSIVRRISEDKVAKAYGKPEESSLKNATNAYMLMYRKVTDSGLKSVPTEMIPRYLRELIKKQQAEEDHRTAELIEKLSHLTVHVYYKQSYKDFEIRTSDTFGELKLIALAGFELGPPEDFRLRGYLPYTDTLKEVYADELTLISLKICNLMNFALEARPEGGEFPEYDPDGLTLKAILWQDGLTPAENIEQPVDVAVKVRVSWTTTVYELMAKLAEILKVQAEDVVIIRKGNINFDSVLVNPPEKWSSSLGSIEMYEGLLLFVEARSEISKWQAEFVEAKKRIVVYFNDPTDPKHQQGNFEYKFSVSISSKLSTATLKERLAGQLKLTPEDFLIKIGNKYNAEVKATSQTIEDADITSNSVLHLDPDPVKVPKAYRIKLFTPVFSDPTQRDSVFDRLEVLGLVEVFNYMTVLHAKQVAWAQLYPDQEFQPSTVQLREVYGSSLGKRLWNEDRIESYSLWDEKAYLFTVAEPILLENDVLVHVKRFFPFSWEFSEAHAITLQRDTPIKVLAGMLEELYGVPVERQELCSSEDLFSFTRLDLPKATWCRAIEQNVPVNYGPLYISRDFTLIIVKDSIEMERELTLEEGKLYQPSATTAPAQWTTQPKPKEAAVSIRVKSRV